MAEGMLRGDALKEMCEGLSQAVFIDSSSSSSSMGSDITDSTEIDPLREQVEAVHEVSLLVASYAGRLDELGNILSQDAAIRLDECSASVDRIESHRNELLKIFSAIDALGGYVCGVNDKVDKLAAHLTAMEKCYALRHPDKVQKVLSSFTFLGGGTRDRGPPPVMQAPPPAPDLNVTPFFEHLRSNPQQENQKQPA